MTNPQYIGMDVREESISIAVRNDVGKIVMECVIETKASLILQFFDVLRGDLQVTFEEGTSLCRPSVAATPVNFRGRPDARSGDTRPYDSDSPQKYLTT